MTTCADTQVYPIGPDQDKGLTMREYFAAMALQGILARETEDWHSANPTIEAVKQADALIKALNDNPS